MSVSFCPTHVDCTCVRWHSDNTSVASVNEFTGYIDAKSPGTARIYATTTDGSGHCVSCSVSVTGDILVTSIELTPSNKVLKVGYSFFPSITVCPADATKQSVTWSSANSNIVSVNSNSGLVYAKAVGTTTIYATACDGSGVCGCCTVRVVPVYVQNVVVCPGTLTLDVGERSCLEATVYPVNATNPNVSWTSGDCNIASVDPNGCVTAKSAGTTYICANATDGSSAHGCCEVTIIEKTTNVSMETAATISDESYTSGYICCPGAEQWFKFMATRSGQYTICAEGNLDTIGTLYDCCGNLITEVDDYAPCGKINFRIICNLTAGNTYYVKIRIYGNDTGSYTLRVTERVFANYVTINKNTITLEKGVTYELPITPNYTYKGYNGAQRIPGLSVSINPSNTNEQKIWWWEQYGSVLECSYGWDDDGDRYIHVTATGKGIAKLYAEDWNENGKRDECTVSVTEGWLECQEPTINSRKSWGARNIVENRLVERTKQPEMIIFHHTADKFQSTDTSKIIVEIKETQNEHINDEGKCDIAYHFIIDPAGVQRKLYLKSFLF